MTHMSTTPGAPRLAGAILGTLAAGLAAVLVACSSAPVAGPAPSAPVRSEPARIEPPTGDDGGPVAVGGTMLRPRARWLLVPWSDLPSWSADRASEAMPALLRSCERPAPAWIGACGQARRDAVALLADDALARAWLESHLRPWRVESLEGETAGLTTGYSSRRSRPRRPRSLCIALYGPPADLASRKPY